MSYDEPRRREPLTVPFIEGRHAAAEGARKRRAMRESGQCCTPAEGPCPAHETEAEGRADA